MKNIETKNRLLTSTDECELYLRKTKAYNITHNILASENKIIDRLLSHSSDMNLVYNELVDQFEKKQYYFFLDLILSSAAFWNPEATKKYREEREKLVKTNDSIKKVAGELSSLLEKRSQLEDYSAFYSNTHYSICSVIDSASQNNGRYTGYLQEKLRSLRGQFDLKYWPSLASIVSEISTDAGKANIVATDPLTDAATASQRYSKSDFLKAFFVAIKENSDRNFAGIFCSGVKLTDRSYAEIANCALGLKIDELVDAVYIKSLRQRLR